MGTLDAIDGCYPCKGLNDVSITPGARQIFLFVPKMFYGLIVRFVSGRIL